MIQHLRTTSGASTRLRDEYGKKCDYEKVAESWELSCHKDGPSVVADGEYKGLTLNEYIEKAGKGVLGKNCERFENFPILIKLIDAKGQSFCTGTP